MSLPLVIVIVRQPEAVEKRFLIRYFLGLFERKDEKRVSIKNKDFFGI
jgi:hypothetical protein